MSWGLLVEFDDPHALVAGCARVRDAGYRRWDAHTPFPIHGMDEAMGIRGTRLPWLILAAGAAGLGAGLLMIWWMNAVDYPLNISGKPLFGLPAAVPVAFELTVLFSAFAAFLGMWVRNGLPRLHHPLLRHERFARATSDRFFIVIESADPRFEAAATRALLESLGGLAVSEVDDEGADR
jgi:hypothetical protein